MSKTVFYSWQSDSPSGTNRNFIESVLNKAIEKISGDVDLEEAMREADVVLDKDTKGVPGSPPIVDTILNKISQCAVFVPDLTFVGRTDAGRLIPNPNVLIEYGWALKVLGHASIVPIMNTAFGKPSNDTLPFDMRHLRHPTTYCLKPDADKATKNKVRDDLVDQMTDYLKLAIIAKPRISQEKTPFSGTPITTNPSTFLQPGETFSPFNRFGQIKGKIELPTVSRLFLRLVPSEPISTIRTKKEVLDLVQKGVRPMVGVDAGGWFPGYNQYGGFVCSEEDGKVSALTQLFMTGELWGINARLIEKSSLVEYYHTDFAPFPIRFVEEAFACTLTNYLKFATDTLHLSPPFRLIAGATDVRGYRLLYGSEIKGNVVDEHISYQVMIDDLNTDPLVLLGPFFNHFWGQCGLDRPKVKIVR